MKFNFTPNYHTKQHSDNTLTCPNIANSFINNQSIAGTLCSSLKHLTVNAAPPPTPTMRRHVKMATRTADFSVVIAIFNANIQR